MDDGAWNKGFDARKKGERQIVSKIETYTHEVSVDRMAVSKTWQLVHRRKQRWILLNITGKSLTFPAKRLTDDLPKRDNP